MIHHTLWVEKYRPTNLSQFLFQDDNHETIFTNFVANKSIPHLLLYGTAGVGKTSIVRVLINELGVDEMDVLTINASSDRGIDTFRDTIYGFATSSPIGEFKIIHLEESDQLTPTTQMALKSFMEEVSDTARFVLTCNTVSKIIPPIRSRCQEIAFKQFDFVDVFKLIATMLKTEKIQFEMPILEQHITAGYPDIRSIINSVQLHSVGGTLKPTKSNTSTNDLSSLLLSALNKKDWQQARQIVCDRVPTNEIEQLYTLIYNNIATLDSFETSTILEDAIIIIADHLYQHSFVADPEICITAMFIKLSQLGR